jgi:type VI secretion system protein ImpC
MATEARVPDTHLTAWREVVGALSLLDLPSRVRATLSEAEPADIGGFVAAIDRVIAALDELVAQAVDAVLHHPDFQRLEAAWRGVAYVVEHVEFQENTEIALWNATKVELADDFERATDRTRSAAFAVTHTAEFGQFGGKPYGAILADFAFDATPTDVALLRHMAAVAAMTHAPFFAAASPGLLRLKSWRELPAVSDPHAIFDEIRYRGWNAFRDEEDSRYTGLLVNRVLLRAPHGSSAAETFTYAERVGAQGEGLLWGSPVFPFAIRLATSFAQHRTLSAIVGNDGDAPWAPAPVYFAALGARHPKPPLEASITPRLEKAFRDLGLIALHHSVDRPRIFLASAHSLQRAKQFGDSREGREATLNYALGTQFPYLFLPCRIAHYLKAIEVEQIGSHRSAEQIEDELNGWLARYIVDMDSVEPAIRAAHPLRHARVRVAPAEGFAGWYRAEVSLRPHLKYLGSSVTLSVSSWLERPQT